jgi:hypothetical protein
MCLVGVPRPRVRRPAVATLDLRLRRPGRRPRAARDLRRAAHLRPVRHQHAHPPDRAARAGTSCASSPSCPEPAAEHRRPPRPRRRRSSRPTTCAAWSRPARRDHRRPCPRAAFAEIVASPRGPRACRRRPRHATQLPELSAAFAEGVAEPSGSTSSMIGLASTDQPLLREWRPRPARRDVHRQPQPGAVQRHQVVSGRGSPRRPGHRVWPRSATSPRHCSTPWDRPPPRRHRPGRGRDLAGSLQRDVLADYAPSCGRWSTCPAAARCGSSSTRATAWADTPCPRSSARGRAARRCRWRSSRSTSNSTAPSPTTRPTRSTRRTCVDLQRGRRRARCGPRPGLRR